MTLSLRDFPSSAAMLNPLIQKLDSLEPLSEDAKSRLQKLPARVVVHAAREDIVREYEPAR